MTETMRPTDARDGWTMRYAVGTQARLERLFDIEPRSTCARVRKLLEAYARSGDPWDRPEMAKQRHRRIDVVLDAMLRHHGVRPDAMTFLALLNTMPELVHRVGDTNSTMLSFENVGTMVRGAAWISPRVRWTAFAAARPHLLITRCAMPATMIAALPGRRLSTILSHPALDPLDLTVDEATGTERVELTLQLPPHAWLHPDGAPTTGTSEEKEER